MNRASVGWNLTLLNWRERQITLRLKNYEMQIDRLLISAVIACLSASTWADALYTYATASYTNFNDFGGPCVTVPTTSCAAYTSTQRIVGSFTTAVPLATNLRQKNVFSQVTRYSFNDGLYGYASTDLDTRAAAFYVSTNAAGEIISTEIELQKWLTGSTPHLVGDRLSLVTVYSNAAYDFALGNLYCSVVGPLYATGATDACNAATTDVSSVGASVAGGRWIRSVESVAVPALSLRSLALLMFLFLGTHVWVRRWAR